MRLARKLLLIGFIIVIIVLGIFIITKKDTSNNSSRLHISASIYPLYFFASEIGKEKADIFLITPAGVEPHEYDPSTYDTTRIEKGNMLIINGGVEGWADKIKNNIAGSKVKLVTAGEGLFTKQLVEEGKNKIDPHVWLSPQLAKKQVEKITEGFIEIDPANTNFYNNNAMQLTNKLTLLDGKYTNGLRNCNSKNIITSHASFGYLASEYGLHQIAISGLSPNEEPSALQLATIADFAKKNNVKYIFFESFVSPRLSETIAHEIGAQTLVLDPIEGISEDDISHGKNYFTIMEANLNNLRKALVCK